MGKIVSIGTEKKTFANVGLPGSGLLLPPEASVPFFLGTPGTL